MVALLCSRMNPNTNSLLFWWIDLILSRRNNGGLALDSVERVVTFFESVRLVSALKYEVIFPLLRSDMVTGNCGWDCTSVSSTS